MEEPLDDTEKEYMLFLLKLLNNYLLDNKVPEWFSIKKVELEPTPVEPEKETE
jgi:hypothetical protein